MLLKLVLVVVARRDGFIFLTVLLTFSFVRKIHTVQCCIKNLQVWREGFFGAAALSENERKAKRKRKK